MNRPAIICPGCHNELERAICQCGRPLQLSGHWESFKSGQEHWNAKLSDEDIEAIRRDDGTPAEIAKIPTCHPCAWKAGRREAFRAALKKWAEILMSYPFDAPVPLDSAYPLFASWLRKQAGGGRTMSRDSKTKDRLWLEAREEIRKEDRREDFWWKHLFEQCVVGTEERYEFDFDKFVTLLLLELRDSEAYKLCAKRFAGLADDFYKQPWNELRKLLGDE